MARYKDMSQEEKDAYNLARRNKRTEERKNWTSEQWNSYYEKRRSYWRNKPEDERKAFNQRWAKVRWERMTPEERLADKERHRQRRANFTAEQLEAERKRGRDNVRRLKMEVLNHYSNGELKCANPSCEVPGGAKNLLALQIDHINGGGYKHSQQLRQNGTRLYAWLKQNNFPSGYQVLCASCNIIKKCTNREDYTPRKNKRVL